MEKMARNLDRVGPALKPDDIIKVQGELFPGGIKQARCKGEGIVWRSPRQLWVTLTDQLFVLANRDSNLLRMVDEVWDLKANACAFLLTDEISESELRRKGLVLLARGRPPKKKPGMALREPEYDNGINWRYADVGPAWRGFQFRREKISGLIASTKSQALLQSRILVSEKVGDRERLASSLTAETDLNSVKKRPQFMFSSELHMLLDDQRDVAIKRIHAQKWMEEAATHPSLGGKAVRRKDLIACAVQYFRMRKNAAGDAYDLADIPKPGSGNKAQELYATLDQVRALLPSSEYREG